MAVQCKQCETVFSCSAGGCRTTGICICSTSPPFTLATPSLRSLIALQARKADAVARLAHAAAAPVTSQLPLPLQRWRLPHPLVHRHLQPSQPGSNAATRWRAKLHPTLPSSSSAFVFAAHAIMLDNGFTCAGTLSFEPNSAPLPSDWSQGAEAYVFHYQHPRSSPPDVVFVLKVLKLCPPSALPPSIRNLHCVTCCL